MVVCTEADQVPVSKKQDMKGLVEHRPGHMYCHASGDVLRDVATCFEAAQPLCQVFHSQARIVK